ncbi:MAG: hypothetical protein JSW49_06515 [candidate division WOR-3 bacterium]|nr:MAG: hypothetical protein JSW49_06515 [candidate division WOR-3 bacterium]
MMKKRLLGLLAITVMCLVTCGNEPPEPFYEGTPEDDAQIDSILTHPSYARLLNTIDGFVPTYIGATLPEWEIVGSDSIFRADSPLVMQHIDSCALSFVDTNRVYDRWYAKDTTCTVYLIDTFEVESNVHVDSMIIGHYDSLYIGPTGDTNWVLDSVEVIMPTGGDAYVSETIEGDGRRLIFLEPIRDTIPTIDEETGDTLGYPVREPLVWQLKRISYGTYYYPTRGTDVPAISRVILTAGEQVDTIISSSTDTTYTGHVMNRFRHIDSLVQYDSLSVDSIEVTIEVDDVGVSGVCNYYAVCAGATPERRQLPSVAGGAAGYLPLTGQNIVNLYFEVVTWNSYYYVNPNIGYYAAVWLIPVRIN